MQLSWTWLVTFWFIFEIFVRIAALFIVPRERKPTSATGWLLLIMIFPTLGLFVFLLIGSPKLSRRRRRAQAVMDEFIARAVSQAIADPKLKKFVHFEVPKRYQPFATLNSNLSKLPAFSGNDIKLISDYHDILKHIAEDIAAAKQYVHIEFFIMAMDEETEELFVAMEAAAARGVKVRVLFDAIGVHKYPAQKKMKRRLTAAGVEWHVMLPLRAPGTRYTRPDLRNHRKIVVIDGRTGYTGSLNIIKRNYHRKDKLYYDELMARVQGPVVVQLQAVFITDWYSETEELLQGETPQSLASIKPAGGALAQVVPSGPGFEYENNLKLFASLIYSAHRRIVITNPYFVPDESLLAAIITAAKRGVEVILLNSDIVDQRLVGNAQRSFYEELLRAGVKIYWYPWPILLHSKHISIDDDICVIGSSNFDIRSFELNLEISMIVYDEKVTRELQKIEDMYISRSTPLTLNGWQSRPWHTKLLNNLARLTSALQ